ncbi:MAG: T9SS type A sorting domain-containing protein [Candidatus Eisenbacteria bacterium]|nr:T9SS type A sorting domain-containing protein [Candidatus Eisenbacteria bacterium]
MPRILRLRSVLCAALLASLPGSAPAHAATPRRLYIANDEHTDYFWTADDAAYRTAFLDMLDYYMDQADSTASNPSDARGRFNCDGSLWVWEYERGRGPAQFQRLVDHLRDGTITMPLNTAVLLYGAMPTEAVLRNMEYAGRLERRFGLRFPLVVPMEDQTLPGGVGALWAGAGARWAWKGICGCATRIDAGHRPREIYRFTGPDGSSVLVKWNSLDTNHGLGGYCEASDPAAAVLYMDGDAGFRSRWPWPVAAAFGYGCDRFETFTTAFVDAAIGLSGPDRRVIVSNEADFFQDFEANYGAQVPAFSGSLGNEWDLYTASMGEVTADFKRHLEKLRTAEALATVASLDDTTFMRGRESARDSAFLACGLYYEHDWTADGPVPRDRRAQFQRDMRDALAGYVDRLHDDALAAVAALVSGPPGVERHLVFNPLSWERTDFADLAVAQPLPVHVVDVAAGAEVPSQPVQVDGQPRVRILASAVPPVGYRVYEVRAGAGGSFPPAATADGGALDNGIYRVAPGARGEIASLKDHRSGDRELVAPGGALHDLGSGNGGAVLESAGPVSATLRVVAGGSPAHETRVTLYAGLDRVDIEGRVTGNFSSEVACDYAFDLPGAAMRHEEVGMIARVARQSNGGDYADQNARTDWLTFNHFVDLSQSAYGVTVSNWDSPFFRAGNSTPDSLDAATPEISAVVGVQVDGPSLGIGAQGGDASFLDRFALRAHGAYDPAAAMRFALEHQDPLVAARVTGGANAPLTNATWSLLTISSPDILLWALKPAEEGIGQGVIARVWNLAEAPRTLGLALPGDALEAARRVTHIETDLGPASVAGGLLTDPLARQQLATYRLIRGPGTGAPAGVGTPPLVLGRYPNPVTGGKSVTLEYVLAAAGRVRLAVLDLRGTRVATIAEGWRAAGPQSVTWSVAGDGGRRLAPGMYFVRLEAAGRSAAKKIVLL